MSGAKRLDSKDFTNRWIGKCPASSSGTLAAPQPFSADCRGPQVHCLCFTLSRFATTVMKMFALTQIATSFTSAACAVKLTQSPSAQEFPPDPVPIRKETGVISSPPKEPPIHPCCR